MAICIDGNLVCLGGGCFSQTPTGVEFSGEAVANQFVDCTPILGDTSGFTSGGKSPPYSLQSTIQSFPFSTGITATCVGSLTAVSHEHAGVSSAQCGYLAGGEAPSRTDRIEKFAFASGGPGVDTAELVRAVAAIPENGVSSGIAGYVAGGLATPAPVSIIQKFSMVNDTPASTSGNLSPVECKWGIKGHSSPTDGYFSSGQPSGSSSDAIYKMPFALDGDACSAVTPSYRCLAYVSARGAGNYSETNGYVSGGYHPPASPCRNNIQKFSFSNNNNATDIGELAATCSIDAAGSSSLTHGYHSGGYDGFPGFTSVIERFPFSSDTPATCVGNLTQALERLSGHQF